MKKTEKILSLLETEFLKIHLDTHYDRYKLDGVSKAEGIKMLRADVWKDFCHKSRTVLDQYFDK